MPIEKPALTRRQFLRLGALGALAWTAASCATTSTPGVTPPASLSTPLVTPEPTRATKLLRNENRAGFYIRYYRPFAAVDPETWRLDVAGLVDAPRAFTLADLLALPQATLEGRMKCVECWSARAQWAGFTYATLAELVKPQPAARWLYVECADGYWETVSIEEMQNARALFVTHLNGERLPDEYGAPLRLMLLWKYGYKSAKALTAIRFQKEAGDGYWSQSGAYTIAGNIEAGWDHPLDLGGDARRIKGGEITEY